MGLEDGMNMDVTSEDATPQRKVRFKDATPLACLRIIFWRDTALVLWMAASPFAVYYCVQTSIPSIYKDIYQHDQFEIGLAYLTGEGRRISKAGEDGGKGNPVAKGVIQGQEPSK